MKTLFLIVQECKMRTFRVILDAYWVLETFSLLHIHRYLLIHCLGIFMCLHWMTATSRNSPKYVVQLVAGHWLQYANLIVRQSSNLEIRIPLRVWAGSWCLWLIVKPFKSLVTMVILEHRLCLSKPATPQDGVWIRGLFLEGAGWDKKSSSLVEANPMQLVCPMPTIHFKPVEGKRRSTKGESILTRGLPLLKVMVMAISHL